MRENWRDAKSIPMNDNGELIMAEYDIAFGQN
jgi:hypothetical protein